MYVLYKKCEEVLRKEWLADSRVTKYASDYIFE